MLKAFSHWQVAKSEVLRRANQLASSFQCAKRTPQSDPRSPREASTAQVSIGSEWEPWIGVQKGPPSCTTVSARRAELVRIA